MSKQETANVTARPCPICGKPVQDRFRPFCSARCQTIDLARWIGGNYRVPAVEEEPSAEDDEAESR